MKKTILILLVIIMPQFLAFSQTKTGYELIFWDEFDSTTFDDAKWLRENYFHGKKLTLEQQCYVDGIYGSHVPTTPNYVLPGTTLKLVVNKEKPPLEMVACIEADEIGNLKCAQDFEYTSAWFESRQKFQYGYFEIRCKLPVFDGAWPAFWLFDMKSSIWYNEIDIFET